MKEFHEARRRGEPSISHWLVICLRDVSHVMRGLYEGKGSQKRVLMVLEDLGVSCTWTCAT